MPQKLKVNFFNGWENQKLILVFDPLENCEHCGIKGSYVVENDKINGICLEQIKKQYTNIEVIEN